MINFFNKNLNAYEEFKAQATPYKGKVNIIISILLGNIFFFFLNQINPQIAFQLIFNAFSFTIFLISTIFFLSLFLGDEKIAKVCAENYIKQNMQRKEFQLKHCYIEGILNTTTILLIINVAIFYFTSSYFLFSCLLAMVIFDYFKSIQITDIINVEIGKLYIEKTHNINNNAAEPINL